MRMHGCAAPLLILLSLLRCSLAPAATTSRVSLSAAGAQIAHGGMLASLGPNGQFIAFVSDSPDVVPGVGGQQLYLYDVFAGTSELLSQSTLGAPGNGSVTGAAITVDGRLVAFCSDADNLVPEDTNGCADVFVRDRQLGTTTRVSVGPKGGQGNGASTLVRRGMSSDGRFVAFQSDADDLVAGDTNGAPDIFVHNLETGETVRVSVNDAGAQLDAGSGDAEFAASGWAVAFVSRATNVVPGVTGGTGNLYVREWAAPKTEQVTVPAGEARAGYVYSQPSLDVFGQRVAFLYGPATPGGAGDHAIMLQVRGQYGWDQVVLRPAFTAGPEGRVLALGRALAFATDRPLFAADTNGTWDIYAYDTWYGMFRRVSVGSGGELGDLGSHAPSVTPDGTLIAFSSQAATLVPGDSNGSEDAFLRYHYVPWFPDVYRDNWAAKEVGAILTAGIAQGYPDMLYHPEYVVTRDQMAAYIARALAGGEGAIAAPAAASFADVPVDSWAFKYVEYVKAHGITSGYPDGEYHPMDPVTRDQMAVYVARALTGAQMGSPGGAPAAQFADVPVDYWAFEEIGFCVEEGIVHGYPDGLYHPTDAVTRDQMAAYLQRAFELPM